MAAAVLTRALPLALAAATAAGYSWDFAAVPTQCGTLALNITGGGGKPPYRALVIPFGNSPFQNEVRTIFEANFTGSSLSTSLKYPANSQFVVVVSDSSSFGSGGASAANQVQGSNDDSCFDKSKAISPPVLPLHYSPSPTQCVATRLFWFDNNEPVGNPFFQGVIPGGQAFQIPVGATDNETNNQLGIGFNWTVDIAAQTELLLLGGDSRGYIMGSAAVTIAYGANSDTSCLNNGPSSTAGTPAGGAYPTSSSSSSGSSPTTSSDPQAGGGGHHTNIGAIIGGVIGGIAALVALLLLLLFLRRRRRFHAQQKERPVDLINDGDSAHDGQLPQYYRPDPFVLPDPSARGSMHEAEGAALLGAGAAGVASAGRPSHDSLSTAAGARPGTPDRRVSGYGSSAGASSSARKGGAPTPLRPVNIIQHDDGGRVPDAAKGAEETIELPPAYTHIRRGPSARVPNVEHAPHAPVSEEGETGSGSGAASESAETSAITPPPAAHVAAA